MASVFKAAGAAKYTIMWRDENGKRHKKTGTTDKATSQRIANDLENKVALRRQGLLDPRDEGYRNAAVKPVAEHLAAWVKALTDKGNTQTHVELFTGRARRVIAVLAGAKLCDVEFNPGLGAERTARAEAMLAKSLGSTRLVDLSEERVQAALASIRAEGRSLGTCNAYRAAIKSFAKWCYNTRRTREDALRGLSRFNAKEDLRHDRRTISLQELRNLIEATQNGEDVMGVPGHVRALVYRLAAGTGLRYSEIRSITLEGFDWDTPSVTVEARYTKNGQTATLALPDDLAPDLAAFVAMLPTGAPVFSLPAGYGAKILRHDLAVADIPYRDGADRVFDFHSLRCMLATLADQQGVSPRVVQRMMRHSTLELTGRYTRPRSADIEAAVGRMPSLKPESNHPEALAMTGTDPGPVCPSATADATDENDGEPNSNGSIALASVHQENRRTLVCWPLLSLAPSSGCARLMREERRAQLQNAPRRS
jgi:integrase